jgi:antitoxin MazE
LEISIIKIGNSKGIRLTKSILERYNIKDKVDLIFERGRIIMKSSKKPREGWAEAFRLMHKNGDDKLLIDDVFEDENIDGWN